MYKKENIAVFPSLLKKGILHGFSWGEDARNMSEAFDDANKIEERVFDFLKVINISPSRLLVRINPHLNIFKDPDILDINKEILKRQMTDTGEIEVGANFIYTSLSDIVLTVKPADCAICLLYFIDSLGNRYVGLCHCSAKEVDKQVLINGIKHLNKSLDINPSEIYICITPAISKDYYFVNSGEINESNWNGFMEKKDNKIFLDILGNILSQLTQAGIPNQNIEYYKIDTFSSAAEGKTFSHRLSSTTNIPEGRFFVAIGLNEK